MAEEKRPEWMTNISSIVDPDEYLLGRKIDKTFELSQKEKADRAREARHELLSKDKIKLSHDPIVDLERRRRQLKMELIQNPVMMKQFRDKLQANKSDSPKAGQSTSDMVGSHRGRKGKVQVQGSKPEMPAFLQRMKEQIVANEDSERKRLSEKRRRERPDDSRRADDDPTIVQLNPDDLTEAEYKRMKKELDEQYKIPNEKRSEEKHSREEFDIDMLIKSNHQSSSGKQSGKAASSSRTSDTKSRDAKGARDRKSEQGSSTSHETSSRQRKVLSYGSSSDESDQ